MRQHHLPGGDKSPLPGSLRGPAVEDAGKFGLRFRSQVSGGGVGGAYSGHWGRQHWERQRLCAGHTERSPETWVPASVLPALR